MKMVNIICDMLHLRYTRTVRAHAPSRFLRPTMLMSSHASSVGRKSLENIFDLGVPVLFNVGGAGFEFMLLVGGPPL